MFDATDPEAYPILIALSHVFNVTEDELGSQLRRVGSLRLSRSTENTNHQEQHQQQQECATCNIRATNSRKGGSGGNGGGSSGTKSDGDSRNLLHVPDDNTRTQQQDSSTSAASGSASGVRLSASGRSARSARHSAPAIAAPAPEYLARSLLQLGCPAVSMPK